MKRERDGGREREREREQFGIRLGKMCQKKKLILEINERLADKSNRAKKCDLVSCYQKKYSLREK